MQGILLTNLGTPAALTPAAIRQFLREFLGDPRVVELPRFLWLPILYGIILPFRPNKTLKLYETIWTAAGSPLAHISQLQLEKLQAWHAQHQPTTKIAFGMRYGEPSIANALSSLAGVTHLTVLPLYPQYSASTVASTFDAVNNYYQQQRYIPTLRFINSYATVPAYITALKTSIENYWRVHHQPQLLLFSFHGIPQRSIAKGDPYADQCHATAQLVAKALNLAPTDWRVVFQSRFGRAQWLQPYCVETLQQLPGEGITDVQVVCPGFAADCLETLQEINIENRHVFMAAGGKSYSYIPALNDSDAHIELMVQMINS